MESFMVNNVHKYRKEAKMTQEEFASKCGVTRQTIISIEQGKYIASLPLALKMAQIFSVRVEDLFVLADKEEVK